MRNGATDQTGADTVILTAGELAEKIGATLDGDADIRITGPAEWRSGGADRIGFIDSPKKANELAASGLGAVVAPLTGDYPGPAAVLRCADPKRAFGAIMALFRPEPAGWPGVHPTAVLDDGVELGEDVCIGPYAVIRAGAVLGNRCVIGAHCYIGQDTVIGDDSRLFPSVTVYHRCRIGRRVRLHAGVVIGADGFGYLYRPDEGHVKFPQTGGVEIGDDVEIGANACVDSGTIEPTTIKSGTKIDNLVMVAHNCRVGAQSLLCGQAGLAGSITLGDGVVIGGHVGIKDHTHIGSGAQVAGGGMVYGDLKSGGVYAGEPARPIKEWMRERAMQRKLPDIRDDLKILKKKVAELEDRLSHDKPTD